MIRPESPVPPSAHQQAVARLARADETERVAAILADAAFTPEQDRRIQARARDLVTKVRADSAHAGSLDAFLQEYALSTQEGVVLMCLAEALLRIPDTETADALIADKIGGANWQTHLGHSASVLVNASTWALMLTGRLLRPQDRGLDWRSVLTGLARRSGEPLIRQAVMQAMRIMSHQFVMGRTIAEATERARAEEARGYRYSYDMLGEAARTAKDAERYDRAYAAAIDGIGKAARGRGPVGSPGISVKLSALHPRFEEGQRDRVMAELVPRMAALCRLAAAHDIGLTVDAEEAERLALHLDVMEALSGDPALAGWQGLGLAVQAYLKRAPAVIDLLVDMARRHKRRLMVRLVKGAYWDTEIKRAQERGLDGYPVFTRKSATDTNYLVCARRLLAAGEAVYPQFATHNAQTLAAVLELAGDRRDFEFQRLHGMGEELYEQVVGPLGRPCRIYAPVGSHEDLLPYLVRRLLENGANTSFVNRIVDDRVPVDEIIADPVAKLAAVTVKPHPLIPLPVALYGAERPNSAGLDLTDRSDLATLKAEMDAAERKWEVTPIIGGSRNGKGSGKGRKLTNPANASQVIGHVLAAHESDVDVALALAQEAYPAWDATPAERRGAILRRAADLYETNRARLMTACVREGGKSLADALAEVREAVDFLRYYAARCEQDFAAPQRLPGPTGEVNEIRLAGRGVFVCISPWNFPLAIFTGQIAAALAAGNTVLAKPAEQTPIVASLGVQLLHAAGVPEDVLHLLPGSGNTIGAALVADPGVAGVAFTGGIETARRIHKTLAAKHGPIVPLIAETGGQNAMIVDSSALTEQVVRDLVISAFQSAGQRCSACRVLFIQDTVAGRTLDMLAGAMDELVVDDPALLSTDVGPVIDMAAKHALETHARRMGQLGRLIRTAPLGRHTANGTFLAPHAFEIESLEALEKEHFGPILHVVRYRAADLDRVVDAINDTRYGLTLGIHSRVETTIRRVLRRARVGNAYVNRSMIGAVVGAQPFGGEGLSGTGPKAGGPRYLHRFAVERVVSEDVTAAGGNASLMSLGDDLG